jgi:hypothetical protein
METEPYQKALRKRKVWIEPLFAEGKLWHGMRRFRTRTLDKVNAETLMTATGQNIKRLLAFGHRGPRKSAPAVALRPPDRLLPDLAHRAFRDHRRKRRIVLRFSTRWTVFDTILSSGIFGSSPSKVRRKRPRLLDSLRCATVCSTAGNEQGGVLARGGYLVGSDGYPIIRAQRI